VLAGGPGTDIQGRSAFPVVTLTLADAQAHARWKGRSLPTEAQWAWAARAARPGPAAVPAKGQAAPAQANTWQGLFPVFNSADDGFVGVAPVACHAANALGLFDLIGNDWELTADAWTPSHAAPRNAPPDQVPSGLRAATGGQHVIKGGSFLCAPNCCMRYRAGARQPQDDDLGASHLGFRTLRNAPGP
jgi:sulfatase modifying factor 1